QAVLSGELTIGMLFAFISYKQQFVDKAARLVERAIEYRMLDLHLERLSDITSAEPEDCHSRPMRVQQPSEANIEAHKINCCQAQLPTTSAFSRRVSISTT